MIRFAAIILVLLTSPIAEAGQAQVSELRLGDWDDRIRLVIEADQAIEASLQARGDVLRLHLQETDTHSISRAIEATSPQRHRMIRRHEIESRPDGSLILELELSAELEPVLFTLNPHQGQGHRVVLDLMFPAGTRQEMLRPPPAGETSGTAIDRSTTVADVSDDQSSHPDLIEVNDIRLGEWEDRTRLVLETDRELRYRLVRSGPGQHLTLELLGISASTLELLLPATIPAEHRLIDRAQISDTGRASVRLDLRLREHTALNIFNLGPGNGSDHRLVLDLLPRPAPAREAVPGRERRAELSPEPAPEPIPEPAPEPSPSTIELLWVEATLNQQPHKRTVLALRTEDGRLMLGEDDLRNWRLRLPGQPDKQHHGEPWYALDNLEIE